jgi:hypothetical protein
MVYNVYKNMWTRAFKQKENNIWIKPRKPCQINDEWHNVDKSWKKLLGIGHWGQRIRQTIMKKSLLTHYWQFLGTPCKIRSRQALGLTCFYCGKLGKTTITHRSIYCTNINQQLATMKKYGFRFIFYSLNINNHVI